MVSLDPEEGNSDVTLGKSSSISSRSLASDGGVVGGRVRTLFRRGPTGTEDEVAKVVDPLALFEELGGSLSIGAIAMAVTSRSLDGLRMAN